MRIRELLAFTSSTEEVNEDGGTVTLTVFRDGGTDGVVTVDYATSGGTATEDQDYTGQTGTLTFADGVDSQSITVDITDDIFIESNETFVVTPSSITGGAQLGSPASVTVTIVEDDAPGELAFSTDTATVSEDGGSITLTVTRTNGNDGVVTVNYQTVDGTGANGAWRVQTMRVRRAHRRSETVLNPKPLLCRLRIIQPSILIRCSLLFCQVLVVERPLGHPIQSMSPF